MDSTTAPSQSRPIRGGLLGILLYLTIVLIVYVTQFVLGVVGTADSPGYGRFFSNEGFDDVPASLIAYVFWSISASVIQIAAAALLIRLMLKRKKKFIGRFLFFTFAMASISLLDAFFYGILVEAEAHINVPGIGFIVMIFIYRYLVKSEQAERTFIND